MLLYHACWEVGNHYQSVIKNLLIQTAAKSSKIATNQNSNVAYGTDFTRNNVNDFSVNTAEECANMQLPRIQKQLQDIRAQQHSKYLNYQNDERKACGTKSMSIITS